VTREEAEDALRHVGALDDDAIDLAGTALVLASFERPRVDLARYRAHLDELAGEVAALSMQGSLAAATAPDRTLTLRLEALNAVLFARHDYAGDELTYDDVQNANLMRVIDRRRGLPVALSILYIHAARAQGWSIEGVNFPGHFLVRLRHDSAAAIVDPFRRGALRQIDELRRMLKSSAGEGAELTAEHYAPVGNRAILLRLENNIKQRLLQGENLAAAAQVAQRMLLLAPQDAALWRESGIIQARLGNLRGAIGALERFTTLAHDDLARHRAAKMIQELRGKLN
jgi:regulator of sirC expression with transglutaminase-like and TPR domain